MVIGSEHFIHPYGGRPLNRAALDRQHDVRRGHLSVELALVLAGVTVATIFGAFFLGDAAKCSFANVVPLTPGQAMNVVIVSETTAASPGDQNQTDESDQAPVIGTVAGMGCFVLAGLAVVIARRLRKRAPEREQSPQRDPVSTAMHQSYLFEKRQNVLRILGNDAQALFEGRMTVGQLMSTHVRTVTGTSSVSDLKKMCDEKKIHHLLVCDDGGGLIGVISDRDFSVRVGQTASDIMTSNPITVTPETLVGPAMTAMLEHRFHCLPVVIGDKPCGMLTTSDLLMALQCALQLMTKASNDSKV